MEEFTKNEIEWIRKNRDSKAAPRRLSFIGMVLSAIGCVAILAGEITKLGAGEVNWSHFLQATGFVVVFLSWMLTFQALGRTCA